MTCLKQVPQGGNTLTHYFFMLLAKETDTIHSKNKEIFPGLMGHVLYTTHMKGQLINTLQITNRTITNDKLQIQRGL